MMLFELDNKQMEKYINWYNKHKQNCSLHQKDGAIGGRESFVFTPTGLGIIIKVKCACGGELDLTDYENW